MDNLIGKKFNRLTVLRKVRDKHNNFAWRCLCDCGKKTIVLPHGLISGRTKSCGCYKNELAALHCKKFITHGKTKTKIYYTYNDLKNRCNREKDDRYENYGGRGIRCLWKSFEEFYKDMGDPPGKGYSIDRINNNGNYCKENCRWATREEQQNNTSRNHLITLEGKTLTIANWARAKNIHYKCIWKRMKMGWSAEQALTLKSGEKR